MIPLPPDLLKLEYLARRYNERNIPLYISYPTSSYWNQKATQEAYVNDLQSAHTPFHYIHIPFCEHICHYCMCYKVPNLPLVDRKHYLQHISKEIELKSSLCTSEHQKQVSHLHWGGGTPTCMSLLEIEYVFSSIARHFTCTPHNGSFSIEAFPDPQSVTAEKCKSLSSMGFNEISFGVQDFNPRVLQSINRSCSFDMLETVVERSRAYGLAVHIDLCYGLPFQELGGFESTIRDILSLEPDRVAMLTYVHYPLLFPNQRNIPMAAIPNSFMRVLLWMMARDLFTGAGYRAIGFDHFVKPDNTLASAADSGTITRDLMGYSVAQRREVLGFGCSAISYLNNTYYHNAKTLSEYTSCIEQRQLPLHSDNSYRLTEDDLIRNYIIQTGILSKGIIDITSIEQKYKINFSKYFKKELTQLAVLENDGLIDRNNPAIIQLTPTGRLFSRHVAAVFDRYTKQGVGNAVNR